ncbi:MAG: acetyltransferase [Balneola sp.]
MSNSSEQHLQEAEAEVIRQACIKAAKEGFMDASISGLCTEGAMEAAISSIQNLDLSRVLKD